MRHTKHCTVRVAFINLILSMLFIVPALADTILFKQPSLSGTEGNFCIRCNPTPGHFAIVQWEANAAAGATGDVPMSWPLGTVTGLYPLGDLAKAQIGLRSNARASGAQIAGDAVGAFIDSADLPDGSLDSKFIITPSIEFSPWVKVFNSPNKTESIGVSFDLQVPVAVDQRRPQSSTYVVSDLMFHDTASNSNLYLNVIIFKNGVAGPANFVFFDQPTSTNAAVGSLTKTSSFMTPSDNSQLFQSNPWTGWRHFSYTVSKKNLEAAIDSVKARFPTVKMSSDPITWELRQWHLNAELLFRDGPARMGWSMRHLTISEND